MFQVILLALVASATAFAPQGRMATKTAISMQFEVNNVFLYSSHT